MTVLTMAYAIGHISGCHINPAVSVGLWMGGRFPGKELVPYVVAQLVGGILGATVLYLIASGGVEHTGPLWCYVFSPLILFVYGSKRGFIPIATLFAITALVLLRDACSMRQF